MSDKLDILIFGAHADDAEIGMGGTIARHIAAGLKVGICDLTCAELSSNGTPELRKQEAARAADLLGLSYRSNLALPDRGLSPSQEHIALVAAEIRKCAPRVVFAPFYKDRHPDHVACSKLVEEAVFNAKLRRYMPELPAVRVEDLFFYFINDWEKPDLLIDITLYQETKVRALACYQSQFERRPEDDSVDTPLTEGYVERVAARDSLMGQIKQVTYAEGFMLKTPLLVDRIV